MNSKNSDFVSAISADVDFWAEIFILIYWQPTKFTGYNLYRSGLSSPLNGNELISSVNTCEKLKSLIPEGTTEWEMLFKAFSSDPCEALARGLTAKEEEIFDMLATINLKLRLARGLGFIDRNVNADQEYVYELRGIGSDGKEVIIAQNIKIVAGHYDLPKPPSDFNLAAGDRKVLATWKRDPSAFSYVVRRSINPAGIYYIVNEEPIFFDIEFDLQGKEIALYLFCWDNIPGNDNGRLIEFLTQEYGIDWVRTAKIEKFDDSQTKKIATIKIYDETKSLWLRLNDEKTKVYLKSYDGTTDEFTVRNENDKLNIYIVGPKPGFLDFQRWSEEGLPISHVVKGITINGPENYMTYYYQVASRDILNRTGQWSGYKSAMPICLTPPMAPINFKVDPMTKDPLTNEPLFGLALSWKKVSRDVNNHQILDHNQTYEIFRADTIEKLYDLNSLSNYYVGSINANPIDPTENILTWNDTDPILIPPYGEKDFWYMIRCVDNHSNVSSPSAAISGRIPDSRAPGPTKVTGAEGHSDHITIYWKQNEEEDLAGYYVYRGICNKGKPLYDEKNETCNFEYIDQISLTEAKARLVNTGRIYYDDYSVPEGSPLCYAYWIRAFDTAQNLYQEHRNCPASSDEYVCQRLYEETPPAVPIISGLKARNNSIIIEWIASPVQDLRAFHIYRSEKEDEAPDFVACILIDGTVLMNRWKGIKPKCEDIPGEINPDAAQGSYKDTKVEPNRVYWYRISALDWLGNESYGNDIMKIPAISTFTYSTDLPIIPVVIPQKKPSSKGCGIEVSWNPPFDDVRVEGYVVFRSSSEVGSYRQVSPIVKGNSFSDLSARRGTNYWYCVQALDKSGRHSKPSMPVQHKY